MRPGRIGIRETVLPIVPAAQYDGYQVTATKAGYAASGESKWIDIRSGETGAVEVKLKEQ